MTEGLIDTELTLVDEFALRLAGELLVDAYGFEQLADLEDRRQRAIVSDTLLASVDGLQTNLREASEHAGLLSRLLGPNGRTMPDPGRPAEQEETNDIDRELVGFFRAAGSTLDCLAAVAIIVTRIPTSVSRASGEALAGLQERAQRAEGDRRACWEQVSAAFEDGRGGNAPGWFEWTTEMRNAVVHRARQLRIWLPFPSRPRQPEEQLLVPTATPMHRLLRYELHLRRSPWLADLDALSSAEEASENWLAEPATETLKSILERMATLAEAVVGSLAEVWEQAGSGEVVLPAPADAWALAAVTGRARAAAEFIGFDPAYVVPPLTGIVASPREAKRAAIAEALRREGLGLDEVEGQ